MAWQLPRIQHTDIPCKQSRVLCVAGSPMWVQVPQAYQPFRLYQLARGLALSSAMGGPAWLQTLQGFLVVTWVFNYGAQMQFTPWLYRWHLQPTDTK